MYATRSGLHLLPSGKGEGAIEPGAVGGLIEDALWAAHDHVLKAAPACAAPVRYVCQRSHLQSPWSTSSHHFVWYLPSCSAPVCFQTSERLSPDMCYEVGECARPVMISTHQVGCLQMSVMLQRHLLSGTYAQDLDTSQLAFLDWHQAQTTTVTSWAGGE